MQSSASAKGGGGAAGGKLTAAPCVRTDHWYARLEGHVANVLATCGALHMRVAHVVLPTWQPPSGGDADVAWKLLQANLAACASQ